MKTILLLTYFFAILSISVTGQTYTSKIQQEQRSDGFDKFMYDPVTIAFFNGDSRILISNANYPELQLSYRMEKLNEMILKDNAGIAKQYIITEYLNSQFMVYNVIIVYDFYKSIKYNESYFYNKMIVLIDRGDDGSMQFLMKFFCNQK